MTSNSKISLGEAIAAMEQAYSRLAAATDIAAHDRAQAAAQREAMQHEISHSWQQHANRLLGLKPLGQQFGGKRLGTAGEFPVGDRPLGDDGHCVRRSPGMSEKPVYPGHPWVMHQAHVRGPGVA